MDIVTFRNAERLREQQTAIKSVRRMTTTVRSPKLVLPFKDIFRSKTVSRV